MKKLFPQSVEFIKYFLSKREVEGRVVYKIKPLLRHLLEDSILNIDADELIDQANEFFSTKPPGDENKCNQLLGKLNTLSNIFSFYRLTAFDFIATWIVLKRLDSEKFDYVEDIDEYIDMILSELHPDIFLIETKLDDDIINDKNEKFDHEIIFLIDHFSYDIISDDEFMKGLFERDFKSNTYDYSYNDYLILFNNEIFKHLVTTNTKTFRTFLEKCIRSGNNCDHFLPSEKEKFQELLRMDGLFLKYMNKDIRNDIESVMLAIESNPRSYELAGESIKHNDDLIKLILNKGAISLTKHIPDISLIEVCHRLLSELHDINEKHDLMLRWIKDGEEIPLSLMIPIEFHTDVELMKKVFTKSARNVLNRLKELDDVLLSNKEFCATIMKNYGLNPLDSFSINLSNDLEIVTLGLTSSIKICDFDYFSYRRIGSEIRENKKDMTELCEKFPIVYTYVSDEIKSDRDLALKMIQKSPIAYRYLSTEFQTDPEFHEIFRNSIFQEETLNTETWPALYTEHSDRLGNDDWLPF